MKMLKGALIVVGLLAGGPALAHADVYGTAEVRIVYDTGDSYAYREYAAYPHAYPAHGYRHRHYRHRHDPQYGRAYGHRYHRHYRGCGHWHARDGRYVYYY